MGEKGIGVEESLEVVTVAAGVVVEMGLVKAKPKAAERAKLMVVVKEKLMAVH
jgi:hypothetical protein